MYAVFTITAAWLTVIAADESVKVVTESTSLIGLAGLGALNVLLFAIDWLKKKRDRQWMIQDREHAAKERAQLAEDLKSRLEAEARERVAVADKVEKKLDASVKVTQDAHDIIAKKVDENTKISVDAFNVANGHNKKIADLAQAVAVVPTVAAMAAVSAVSSRDDVSAHQMSRQAEIDRLTAELNALRAQIPTKVEVINSPESPVPVTSSEPK